MDGNNGNEMPDNPTVVPEVAPQPIHGAIDIGNALGHWGQVVSELATALAFAKTENAKLAAAVQERDHEIGRLRLEISQGTLDRAGS